MESPFYFTIPLKMRLDFLKYFSQQFNYNIAYEYIINTHIQINDHS